MKALVAKLLQLEKQEVKIPRIKDNDVLIKVWAVGVNADDIIALKTRDDGFCPGFECSGIIEAVGRNVNHWKVGERVCALLEGGGYAEKVAVPADFLLPLPDDIDLYDAAALPYTSCCIWLALLKMHAHQTTEDKSILIREGFNGIGPLAIQYAKYMGLKVITSTGNINRSIIYDYYGSDFCVDETSRKFNSEVLEKTGNLGVDFVLGCGAKNLERNLNCCRNKGKVAIMQLDGTRYSFVSLIVLQQKKAGISVIDLLSKDFLYKASVIAGLKNHLWPAIFHKEVVVAIDHYFSASEVEKALDLIKKKDSIGKIILRMDFDKFDRHLKMQ